MKTMTDEQLLKLFGTEKESNTKILRDRYVSSRDTFVYDYIEERLAYTDFVKLKITISLLEKALFKTLEPVDIIGAIETEIKTEYEEKVPIDIENVIQRKINNVVIDNQEVIDDVARQEIDNILVILNAIFDVIDGHSEDLEDIKSINEYIKNEVKDLIIDIDDLNNELNNTKNDLNNTINELNNTKTDLNNTINDLNNTKIDLNNTIDDLNRTKTELENVKKQKNIDTTEFTKTLQQYQKKLIEYDKANKDIHSLLVKYKEANEKLAKDNSLHVREINRIKNNNRQRNSCWNTCDDGLTNWTRNVMYGKCC